MIPVSCSRRGFRCRTPNASDALPAFKSKEVIELFERTGVLTNVELGSRFEVYSEQYILSIELEAKLVVDMAKTIIYPAAITYLADLSTTNIGLNDLGIDLDTSITKAVATSTNGMMKAVEKLSLAMAEHGFASTEEHMNFCAGTMRDLMTEVRTYADELETMVADDLWPLPKYQEMLFMR